MVQHRYCAPVPPRGFYRAPRSGQQGRGIALSREEVAEHERGLRLQSVAGEVWERVRPLRLNEPEHKPNEELRFLPPYVWKLSSREDGPRQHALSVEPLAPALPEAAGTLADISVVVWRTRTRGKSELYQYLACGDPANVL